MSNYKNSIESNIEIQKIMEAIEKINYKLENIEKNQKLIDDKLNIIQNSINGIESDIYEDEYEFEIICPYCNAEFVADITSKKDIKCPECQNIIELDWNSENDAISGCSGSCTNCGSKCGDSWLQEFEADDSDEDDD